VSKQTLLIDFDGTLAKYDGWKGLEVLGDPLEKARHAMLILSKHYKLICFTTRLGDFVEPWLRRHGFPEMEVTNIKKPAHLIIDDRALRFDGQWTDELIEQIRNFEPWWKEKQVGSTPPSAN